MTEQERAAWIEELAALAYMAGNSLPRFAGVAWQQAPEAYQGPMRNIAATIEARVMERVGAVLRKRREDLDFRASAYVYKNMVVPTEATNYAQAIGGSRACDEIAEALGIDLGAAEKNQ